MLYLFIQKYSKGSIVKYYYNYYFLFEYILVTLYSDSHFRHSTNYT